MVNKIYEVHNRQWLDLCLTKIVDLFQTITLTTIYTNQSVAFYRTPIERKERAEEYMKNFQMIKMAQKFLKKQEESKKAEVNVGAGAAAVNNSFQSMQGNPNRASTFKKNV